MKETPYGLRNPPSKLLLSGWLAVVSLAVALPWLLILWLTDLVCLNL